MAETAAHPQPSYHIADIFREHRSELDDQSLNLDQRRLVGSIVVCRIPALGGICTSAPPESRPAPAEQVREAWPVRGSDHEWALFLKANAVPFLAITRKLAC